MTRRELVESGLSVAVWVAFARYLALPRALAAPVAAELDAWTREIDELCRDLGQRTLAPVEWQQQIARLLERVELEDLLAAIRFDELENRLDYPDLGVVTTPVRLPGLDAGGAAFFSKLFGMERDRAIIPHGHSNMASAHLVVGGTFHLRQFERVEREADAWIVTPTVDRHVGPGTASSISDEKNNVHWLIARGGRAYTLDVIVTGIDPHGPAYTIDNLDADRAEPLAGGRLRMPKLGVEDGLHKYGHDHHGRDS